MVPEINIHNVTDVIVRQHKVDRENGDTWFVSKDILVVDESGKGVIKLTLFGDDFRDVRFQSQAEFDGLIDKDDDLLSKVLDDNGNLLVETA